MVHNDLGRSQRLSFLNGNEYYITFIDAYTKIWEI